MLVASHLRWAPLPPALFPNGFVFFRRPLEPSQRPTRGPMLLHCNWINSIAAKRFLLREVRLWDAAWLVARPRAAAAASLRMPLAGTEGVPAAARTSAPTVTAGAVATSRYLWYSADEHGSAGSTLGAQMEALRVAMALARFSNRTLILRRFEVLPLTRRGDGGGMSAAGAASLASKSGKPTLFDALAFSTRLLTFYFEYGPFARHFPSHSESSLLDARWPDGPPPPHDNPATSADALAWRTAHQASPL
eukprot:6669390-Prymnesium_polylepis.1